MAKPCPMGVSTKSDGSNWCIMIYCIINLIINFSFIYFPGTSKIKTIRVKNNKDIEYVYDEEYPEQLVSMYGYPVIYNLQGRMIEFNKFDDEAEIGVPAPEGSKTCPACTFLNDYGNAICDICETVLM